MHADILNKLHQLMIKRITSEAEALYFMAQIRKSLEHKIISLNNDTAIRFYCDWVLHNHLKGAYAQEILKKLAPVHDFYLDHETEDELPDRIHTIIRPIIDMDEFRAALQDYLVHANLPETIVCAPQEWHRFLELYLKIIEDCPLTVRGDNTSISIKEIVLRLSHNLSKSRIPINHQYSFSIHWDFIGKDGSKGGVNNHLSIPMEFLTN